MRVVILCSISELNGYAVLVSTDTSRSRNEFFDVKMKISESKSVTVCILKQTNQTTIKVNLERLSQEGESVKLKSLSETQSRMFFLISHNKVQLIEQTQLVLILEIYDDDMWVDPSDIIDFF